MGRQMRGPTRSGDQPVALVALYAIWTAPTAPISRTKRPRLLPSPRRWQRPRQRILFRRRTALSCSVNASDDVACWGVMYFDTRNNKRDCVKKKKKKKKGRGKKKKKKKKKKS